MIRAIAYLRCKFYYELGSIIIHFAAYDALSDAAYSIYNACMHRSIDINDNYNLAIWKKP